MVPDRQKVWTDRRRQSYIPPTSSGDNKIAIFSLKIIFVLENSVDPDEMPHYAAFNLGLLCLQL